MSQPDLPDENAQAAKTSSWRIWVVAGVFLIALFPALLATGQAVPNALRGWALLTVALIAMAFSLWATLVLSVLAHEVGHWMFAWLAGSRLVDLRAGALTIQRRQGRVRLTFDRKSKHFISGHCHTERRQGEKTRAAYLFEGAGGPAVTLALVAFGVAVYANANDGRALAKFFGFELAAVNFMFLAYALSVNPGRPSDARKLIASLDADTHRAIQASGRVRAAWSAGTRARDWDGDCVESGKQGKDKSVQFVGYLLSYFHGLDSGRPEEALQDLEQCAALGSPSRAMGVPWTELAFARAWIAHDLKGAEDAWRRVDQDAEAGTGHRERALAAMALVDGRPADAGAHCAKAKAWLLSQPNADRPNMQAEIEWVDAIEARARAAQGGA